MHSFNPSKLITLLFLGFGLFACRDRLENNEPPSAYRAPLHIDLEQTTLAGADPGKLFQLQEIIPLESAGEAMLAEVSKVILLEDKYLVGDFKHSMLKVFDRSGSYLYDIGKKGRGPGEFTNLRAFQYDPFTNSLFLYCRNLLRLSNFHPDGRFISSVELPFYPDHFVILDSLYFAFYLDYIVTEYSDSSNLVITDRDFSIVHTAFPFQYGASSLANVSGFLARYGEETLFMEAFSDTVFQLSDLHISPKYVLHLNKLAPRDLNSSLEKLITSLLDYNVIESLTAQQNLLHIAFMENKLEHHAYWFKKEQLLLDLPDCQPHAFRYLFKKPVGTLADKVFIAAIQPADVMYLKHKHTDLYHDLQTAWPDLFQTLEGLDEGSNPVLVKYTLTLENSGK